MTQTDEKKGYIFEIQKMSTEDGPGIRTTVFFKECPLHCVWCHNPESIEKKPSIQWYGAKCIGCKTCIEICPENALLLDKDGMHIDRIKCTACGKCTEECPSTAMRVLGEYWTIKTLYREIEKDLSYYVKSNGGVTASGGEAGVQTDFLVPFFKKCKENGIHTALDLCGILPKEKYEKLLPYTDLYLYDLKEIDQKKHKEFTGVSNEIILENIIWLIDAAPKINPNAKIWVRTPIIPNFTATKENITGIGRFIVEKLHNMVDRWDLLAYNNLAKDKYDRMDLDYACEHCELFTKEEMENFLEVAKSTGVKNVQWSGLTKTVKAESSEDLDEEESEKFGIKEACFSTRPPGTC